MTNLASLLEDRCDMFRKRDLLLCQGRCRSHGDQQDQAQEIEEIPPRLFKKAKIAAPENSPNPPKVFFLKNPKENEALYRELFLDTREMKTFWNRKGGVVVKV